MQELETLLQHNFSRLELLEQALTHKSFRYENGSATEDNEKLEFLGDAVLDLALSNTLMLLFPTDQEGALSKKRASLVNEECLAQMAKDLGFDQRLRLGKGERQTGGGSKPRLLASSFEAVIGAVFCDAGYEAAAKMIERLFIVKLRDIAREPDFATDFKTRLQELAQEKFKTAPHYKVEHECGPDHDKQFEVSVALQDRALAKGIGRSKKAAEQEAARLALEQLAHANTMRPEHEETK